MPAVDTSEIERVFRSESGRAVATLVRFFGDIDLAEEAVQDAFVVALQRWPEEGLPPSPAGWIITTARRRGIDHIRRESTRDDRQAQAMHLNEPHEPRDVGPVTDDQLRLIFTCCHPALAPEVQVALTLRLIAGLQTPEIAKAFLVPEPTMAQRIVRAKKKIKAANIPYRVPEDHELPDRLPPVLSVVYLVFNEGYVASSGDALVRTELCLEAIRLARHLAELMPDEPEVLGLLALLLLTESRRAARTDAGGSLVRLPDQDRSLWDAALIEEGQAIVRELLRRNTPGSVPDPGRHRGGAQRRRTAPTTPSGTRSSRCTTSSTRWCRRRSSPSTAPSPSPSTRDPKPAWRSSTTSICRSTTSSPPPAPTSSSASAATTKPSAPTRRRWPSPTTKPSATSSTAAGASCSGREAADPNHVNGTGWPETASRCRTSAGTPWSHPGFAPARRSSTTVASSTAHRSAS